MMKKITFLFLFISSILLAQNQRSGTFVAGPQGALYPVSGSTALEFLSNGTKRVVFKSDFNTIQGITLEVFLSTAPNITSGSNIKISSQQLQDDNGGTDMSDPITGFKIFDVPSNVAISDYDYIIIQCTSANILWGSVALGASTTLNHCERSGSFVAGPQGATYPVSGTARIEFLTDGTKQVLFDDNFATIQGLRLEVFLSKTGVLNLGTDLKISTQQLQDDNGGTDMSDPITGYKRFVVPANVELEDFDNILIQCTQADLLWGNVALSTSQGSGCSVLSVEEEKFGLLKVYPNPTKDYVEISSNEINGLQAKIFSITGREISSHSDVKSRIDLSELPSGIYLISIFNDKRRIVQKVHKI